MPTLTKHASIPATVTAVTTLPNGTEVRVTGAGPWTVTQAEADALAQARVVVSGTLYKIHT